ncbi:YwiC-like family protein [Aquihabitans sp. McL0605]|uniref:YwiC-like family protein n=1 Tax=Aquihabitans sp. McL0605 TaxID=3415671 RepID=UPI003CFA1EE7
MVAFLARTPLKIAVIDQRRGRNLARTRLARRVAAGELTLLALLAIAAVVLAAPGFWIPGAVALPLLAVEAWFDVRSTVDA